MNPLLALEQPALRSAVLVEHPGTFFRTVRQMMETIGYHVAPAHTPDDAIRVASEVGPNVLVINVAICGATCALFVTRLRSVTDAPIVLLSERGEERAVVEALEAGAQDFLPKPFGFDELNGRIRTVTNWQIKSRGR